MLKGSGQFTSFCTFGGSIAGLAGAGAGGKLRCTFINGKFCFKVAASLCWGAGAKGAFLAEVDAGAFAEFGAWLLYQLYSLDYGFFDVVDRDAFKVYSQLCVMQVAHLETSIYRAGNKTLKTLGEVSDAFKKTLDGFSSDLNDLIEGGDASQKRNVLAKNIIQRRQDLLRYTPEAKGILLYLLTRHGTADHADLRNRTIGLDIYADRKEAIVCVLTSIQTIGEWYKVLCRLSENGSDLAADGNVSSVAESNEAHLIRFLQEGHNRDDDLRKAKWNIQVVKARIKNDANLGYALALNDTSYYSLTSELSTIRQACEFGPCEIVSKSWV